MHCTIRAGGWTEERKEEVTPLSRFKVKTKSTPKVTTRWLLMSLPRLLITYPTIKKDSNYFRSSSKSEDRHLPSIIGIINSIKTIYLIPWKTFPKKTAQIMLTLILNYKILTKVQYIMIVIKRYLSKIK